MSSTRQHTLTIASAASVSDGMSIVEVTTGSLLIPAAFSGTTLTFQASLTLGGTYSPVRNASNAEVSLDVTTSAWHAIPTEVMTHDHIKLVSEATEPVEQSISVVTKVP
ncbi:hypothetical protein LCGC14_1489680 [marine sediment metagenome]|uniref:Uncharacterized protein n=1 Tax=marine sediment metagenome TaxID=412755 RepID=A0A0F9J7S0_9ZZZZ|nr:hypothetical protein [Phycisphaerae bacterium]HDZ44260.1 hypothetical protein [Phycisphaerae bacterium]